MTNPENETNALSLSPTPINEAVLFNLMEAASASSSIDTQKLLSDDPLQHVCSSHTCPYLTCNGDGTLVCLITGQCHQQTTKSDAITAGRINPLDANGVARSRLPVRRKRKRINQHQAEEASRSCTLHSTSHDVEEQGYAELPAKRKKSKKKLASGGKTDGRTVLVKRSIGSVETMTMDRISSLRSIACGIVDSLTGSARRTHVSRSTGSIDASVRTGMNRSFRDLYLEAGHKYINRMQLEGLLPTVDHLHNLALNLKATMDTQKKRVEAHAVAMSRSFEYIRTRDLAANLAVTLWICALNTTYMRKDRKTQDSFKPFASAVFFSMRRGVRIAGSTVEIVPRCALIANALPEVRSQHSGRQSHTHHLAAHRGTSTLHLSIGSVPEDTQAVFFAPAITVAAQLASISTM